MFAIVRSVFVHRYVRHLRLNFNLFLSPIFLWGVLLAGGGLVDIRVWFGYLALHLFLYGGANAFNSFCDRDEGPIGGLLEPPPVDRGLLWFSLIMKLLGLPLALWIGWGFTVAWLLLFLGSIAYSHPLVRLKANPAVSLVAVALGQGGVGFAAGWLISEPDPLTLLESRALLGVLTTSLILVGLYIVTQSYQTVEDRKRGDMTLPLLLGPRRALLGACVALGVGGSVMATWVVRLFGWDWALLLVAFFGLLGAWLIYWALRFEEADVVANFRTTMRYVAVGSAGLGLFLLAHLTR